MHELASALPGHVAEELAITDGRVVASSEWRLVEHELIGTSVVEFVERSIVTLANADEPSYVQREASATWSGSGSTGRESAASLRHRGRTRPRAPACGSIGHSR